MDGTTKLAYLAHMRRIRARERLEFIVDVGTAFDAKPEHKRDAMAALAKQAFAGDEAGLAAFLEGVSRLG